MILINQLPKLIQFLLFMKYKNIFLFEIVKIKIKYTLKQHYNFFFAIYFEEKLQALNKIIFLIIIIDNHIQIKELLCRLRYKSIKIVI